jgi:hypothetical protein
MNELNILLNSTAELIPEWGLGMSLATLPGPSEPASEMEEVKRHRAASCLQIAV